MAEKEESGFSWSALGNFGMSAFENMPNTTQRKIRRNLTVSWRKTRRNKMRLLRSKMLFCRRKWQKQAAGSR